MVEYFSGKAQVSAAFREAGYSVGSYDYLYNEKGMDFLSPGGFGFQSQSFIVGYNKLQRVSKIQATLKCMFKMVRFV
jgi:hypothetical protein